MDPGIKYVKVSVPSKAPRDITFEERYRVGVEELIAGFFGEIEWLIVETVGLSGPSNHRVDSARVNKNANYPKMVLITHVILDVDVVMVVQSWLVGVELIVTQVETLRVQERLSSLAIPPHLTAWQSVDKQVQPVILSDPLIDKCRILLWYTSLAQLLTC